MVFSFHKLFPDFICANNTQSLVISSFGVKILISVPSFASSSSPSCGEVVKFHHLLMVALNNHMIIIIKK